MSGQWIAAEAIADALNAANAFREEFGEDSIPDLPPSVPGEPRRCVLAQAFNFDCRVDADGDGWYAEFNKFEHAEALALIFDTTPKHMYGSTCRVYFPESIGEIAIEFDNYGLENKYYEEGNPRQRRERLNQ